MARTDACTHQADRRRRCLPSVEMPEVGRTDTGTDEAAKEDKAREVARESVHGGAPGGRRGALTLLNAACRQAAAAASGLPRIARPGLAWPGTPATSTAPRTITAIDDRRQRRRPKGSTGRTEDAADFAAVTANSGHRRCSPRDHSPRPNPVLHRAPLPVQSSSIRAAVWPGSRLTAARQQPML